MNTKITQYSRAVYDIAKEDNETKKFVDLSFALLDLSKETPIFEYLGSYSVSVDEKHKLINELVVDNNIYKNWLYLLVDSGLFRNIKKGIEELINIYNDENGIVKGYVWTTEPITREVIDKLQTIITNKTNKETILENRIDKTIIGGIRLEVGESVWDNTIKNRLYKLLNEGVKE